MLRNRRMFRRMKFQQYFVSAIPDNFYDRVLPILHLRERTDVTYHRWMEPDEQKWLRDNMKSRTPWKTTADKRGGVI